MASQAAIERRARQLLREYGADRLPVDVYDLASKLGVVVREQSGDSDISGALFREGDRVLIGINASHHPRRKRFTVAHELGHLLLHDQLVQVDRHYMTTPGHPKSQLAALRSKLSAEASDPREIEANRFAAALLMPADLVERHVKRHRLPLGEDAVRSLAAEFDVSTQAMNYRLQNLGAPLDLAGHG